MSEVWGLLEKSLTDDETINEAINAAIAAHEADASAHLGVGESLEAHKTSEIIDHLAGSVVADKFSMDEKTCRTSFEDMTRWFIVGTQSAAYWPGFEFEADYNGVSPVMARAYVGPLSGTLSSSYNFMFQTLFKFDFEGDIDHFFAYFGYGYSAAAEPSKDLGFKIDGGAVYGCLKYGGTEHFVNLSFTDIYELHVYRAIYDKDDGVASFYIDGVLKGTLNRGASTFSFTAYLIYYLDALTEDLGRMAGFDLLISCKY